MPYSALDLTGGKKIDGYNTLFSGSGEMNCEHGLDIDREDWEQGYGLFRFDLTPAGSGHPDHLIPHRTGNVNLCLKFGTETDTGLNSIVYAEFQNQLEIDRNRRVVYDLSQGSTPPTNCGKQLFVTLCWHPRCKVCSPATSYPSSRHTPQVSYQIQILTIYLEPIGSPCILLHPESVNFLTATDFLLKCIGWKITFYEM